MKRFLLATLLLLAAPAAWAQQVSVQNSGSELRSSTSVCATAPAINATQAAGTCTIPAVAGLSIYINSLQVGACGDNTANAINTPQLAFTSTNLGGWTQQFSFMQGATVATVGPYVSCVFMGGPKTFPLKAAAAGTAVTVIPPAQQAHSSYPINIEYYYAP